MCQSSTQDDDCSAQNHCSRFQEYFDAGCQTQLRSYSAGSAEMLDPAVTMARPATNLPWLTAVRKSDTVARRTVFLSGLCICGLSTVESTYGNCGLKNGKVCSRFEVCNCYPQYGSCGFTTARCGKDGQFASV
jgi:hypothetical protein